MMGNILKGEDENKSNMDNNDSTLRDSEDEILIVLQDYPSPDVSEPLFRMGEKLKAVSQEVGWWRVQSGPPGSENYIPNNYVAKVYHGWLFEGVMRRKAEELLQLPGHRVGSFMVRESIKEKGVYSLSVKHRSIKHYKVLRLDNSWYYISPRLTFQCLEDMVNHYSDSADGLCCVLTTPCLSGNASTLEGPPQAPPVVMRRHFDWKKVDRKELVSLENPGSPDNNDAMVSYGVRNSMASYLSLTGALDPAQDKKSRKKKSKSLYVLPNSTLENMDYDF
ncbi:src like adaptor 1a [Osmerus eperlanus]|uniref:src like adaptor 1a n=1 Tax=Osmerus eperlanus TaxID=29151 RepID=UPI002E12D278